MPNSGTYFNPHSIHFYAIRFLERNDNHIKMTLPPQLNHNGLVQQDAQTSSMIATNIKNE